MSRIQEIKARLAAVEPDKPWRYTKREMFIGTTNALEMYDRVLDLGRAASHWERDETGNSLRMAEESRQRMERVKALGEFLECCREDIAYLLEKLEERHGK